MRAVPPGRAAPCRRALLLAAALPCFASAPAFAHDPAEPLSEEIEVSGHYENAVGTTDAASAGRIGRELVEDRPILRPGELLELVPGLIITQHSGAGKANQYFLRGFNLDHGTDFATSLDGVPLNLRTHAHGQGYTDLNFLIPELVQRVDYFKGPYFASKGDFASAGAADIHYADALPKTLFSLTGGSFFYGRALFAGSPELLGGNLMYALELFHDDGPWVRPDDYRRLNGVLRYAQRDGERRWSVTAMGYVGDWNATDQVPLRAVESGAIDRFGAVDDSTGGRTHRFSLSGDYRQAIGESLIAANVYAVKYRLNLFSDFTYFLADPVNGDQIEQADDRWIFGTSGEWVWASTRIPLHLSAGWEARHDRIDPVGLYPTTAQVRRGGHEDRVRETSGAVFAEAAFNVTPWLRTVGGLRYDHYFFQVESDTAVNSGTADAGRLSPKASVVLGPWARTEAFLNFGLGFHSNDARGVTARIDPASGQGVTPVTPLVQTRGAELGLRSELLHDVQSSLSFWRLDMDSELVFVGDAGTVEPSRPSRRYGVEWDAQWHPVRWLVFDVMLAWSHARFTGGAPDHIPGSIEWASSAGATLHELGPFRASLFMRYFGPRPLIEDDSVRSTASTLFNLQGSYDFTPWARLSLEVFNIFDAQVDDISYFYRSRLTGEPAAGVDDVHFHPATPRNFRVSAAFRW